MTKLIGLISIVCILLFNTSTAQSQGNEPESDTASDAQSTPAEEETTGEIKNSNSRPVDEVFIPSEELSEDSAAPFPTDI